MSRKSPTVAAVPAAVLLFSLVACGSGSDSGSGRAKAADNQQSARSSGGQAAAGDTDGKTESPLTGEIKQKAEAAAVAAFLGTVVKSEENAEKPGLSREVKGSATRAGFVSSPTARRRVRTRPRGNVSAARPRPLPV
ncbi:hypothetical protein ACFZDJ_52535 [Streptomyces sp. NPDC007896]|uniref:hypothetical protein n=1 Tax=Streptomyces sp. NPDC007896 TaxID=3364784 RepID=UPI0036EB6A9A